MATLEIPTPGYAALAQRLTRPLAASQAFNPVAVVGLDAAGKVTPFLTGTVAGIQFALGLLDPTRAPAAFTSGSADTSPVLTGHISFVNGTSGNALAQANAGAPVYTADGLTANVTSGSNPLPVTGTTTGKLLGTFLCFDPAVSGNVIVSVIPEINDVIANSILGLPPGSVGATQLAAHAATPAKVAALTREGVVQLVTGPTANTVLAGAAVGDLVVMVTDLTALGNTPTATTDIDATAKFESAITVAGHIQQIGAPAGKQANGDYCQVILQRQS